ncbi:MAG: hypothetical protein HXY23_10975 [Parvularculaceae bacterium]|nr:hypothetical protein [Parvularculaceae bacterium]
MSLNRGVLPPDRDRDFFIGWARAPVADRRFILGSLPFALAGAAGLGFLSAQGLGPPGAGAWKTGAVHRVTGVLATRPYPMLYVADPASPFDVRTVLVVAQGKCTSSLDLAAKDGRAFRASGVLIERGNRQMLEVPLALEDWIAPSAEGVKLPPLLPEPLGRARLSGQIMDSKCFFGVMRPSRGRTHKACASLCIRGGIPPSFWARGADGREAVLLMTDAKGGALGESILPFVADPVEAEGELVRVGDLVQFRADAGAYRRL